MCAFTQIGCAAIAYLWSFILINVKFLRELLELSEALQRDLVQSRAETLHYKQQIENRQYLLDQNEKNLQIFHKVKHSQSDLFPQQNNQMLLVQQPTTNNQSQQQLMMMVSANKQTPTGVLNQHIINNDIR